MSSASSPKKKASSHWITVSFLICFCYFLDLYSLNWLPDVNNNSLDFSVSAARKHLQDLVALGPRVAGTYVNEVQTVELLKTKLKAIQQQAPSHVKVEIDEQYPSGELYLGFLNGITNIYKNVSNVIVRISWPEVEAEHGQSSAIMDQATLVNAHFDSAPGSPGASDDGIGIAVMIEATRSLVMGKPLKKPIIMLFNGAEESNHHAAHGFITKHKWAKSVKYLFNLEAIGAGGREMVFQCNSGELMALYGKSAPYRHAHAVAHELFKHIIWRAASTDWRTILQYGSPGMHGLDTAYLQNGYVYHTRNDKENILQDGTFLNTGANVLQLSKALSLSTEEDFSDENPTLDPGLESVVFFDILAGWMYFSYRGVWVIIIHLLVVIFGLCTVFTLCRSTFSHVSTMLIDEVKCLVVPILGNAALGLFCHVFCPMTWYVGGKGYALLLYLPPAILSAAWVRGSCVASRSYLSGVAGTTSRQASSLFLWMSLATPMIFIGLVSVYPLCIWIGFSSIAMIMHTQVVQSQSLAMRKSLAQYSSRTYLSHYYTALQFCDEDVIYMICLVPCTIIWCSLCNIVLSMLIPLVGKSGTVVPGDLIVAAVIGILVALPAGTLLANHVHTRVNVVTLKTCGSLIVVMLFYTFFFHNVAYSAQRPKRLWVQHIDRTIERTVDGKVTSSHDHGIWVSAFDGQGLDPLLDLHHSQIQDKHHAKAECTVTNGDCSMEFPWYFPVPDAVRDSMFIPTQTPPVPKNKKSRLQLLLTSTTLSIGETSGSIHDPPQTLTRALKSKEKEVEVYRYIDITLVGSTHMALVIRDRKAGSRIISWDLHNMNDVTDASGNVDAELHKKALQSFQDKDLVTPYVTRAEGIHYFQIGFGFCPNDVCTKIFRLKVRGEEPVEFSAYSHYVDSRDWEEDTSLQAFHNTLPKWSQGAYFTQFPSILVSKNI